MIQAMSGLMSITGEADGMPSGGPMRVGVAVIDRALLKDKAMSCGPINDIAQAFADA